MIIKSEVLYSVLTEGRLEDVKSKFPGREAGVDNLSKHDPSGNNKYLAWMCKMVFEQESVPKHVIDAVTYFHNNNVRFEQKDINQYKNLKQLLDAVEVAKSKVSKKEIKESGVEKIFENDNVMVLHPKTHAASCKYGSDTRWCVTMRHEPSYFRNYSGAGPLFFFIDKRRLENEPGLPRKRYWKVAAHYNVQRCNPISIASTIIKGGVNAVNMKQINGKEHFLNNMENCLTGNRGGHFVQYYNSSDAYVTAKTVIKYIPDLPEISPKLTKYVLDELGRFYDSYKSWWDELVAYEKERSEWLRDKSKTDIITRSVETIPQMGQQLIDMIKMLDPDVDVKAIEAYIKKNWKDLADQKIKSIGGKVEPRRPATREPRLTWYDVDLDNKLDAERRNAQR